MPQLDLIWMGLSGLAVALFWATPERHRQGSLTAASTAFLLWLDPASWVGLAVATGVVWAWPADRSTRWHLPILLLSLGFVAVRTLEVAGDAVGLGALAPPLGFGFYVLRLIHYRVERTRGTFREHGLLDVLSWASFWPAVLIGPIHRFDDWQRCDRRRRWDPAMFASGLERVLYGYVKVVVLANWLVFNRDLFLDTSAWAPAPLTLFECLQYGLYLYFAFAGYSDIAIGLGRLVGHELVENFDHPFTKPNIGAFWRSWHLSLSDWCRRYIFLPVMARTRAPVVGVFLSMLVLGLWHAFTLHYLLWGLYHATGIAVWRLWQGRIAPRLPGPTRPWTRGLATAVAILLTFVFVMAGFLITKNISMDALAQDLRDLASGWSR